MLYALVRGEGDFLEWFGVEGGALPFRTENQVLYQVKHSGIWMVGYYDGPLRLFYWRTTLGENR